MIVSTSSSAYCDFFQAVSRHFQETQKDKETLKALHTAVRALMRDTAARKACAADAWFRAHLNKAIDENKLMETDGIVYLV